MGEYMLAGAVMCVVGFLAGFAIARSEPDIDYREALNPGIQGGIATQCDNCFAPIETAEVSDDRICSFCAKDKTAFRRVRYIASLRGEIRDLKRKQRPPSSTGGC